MKHLVTLRDHDPVDIRKMIDNAFTIKNNPRDFSNFLAGKKVYLLYQKTSTRTALSFETGITELGGSFYSQKWEDSNFTVGEIRDEVRYLGKNIDLIMARLKNNSDINEMSNYSTVPVINGCCNMYHPCQALADMLTVKELFNTFKVKLLYIGVRNNVFNSLLNTLPRLGGDLYALTPITNDPSVDEYILERGRDAGNLHEIDHTGLNGSGLKEIINEMNIVYTDTWIDMEFFNDPSYAGEQKRRIDLMLPFQVNDSLLKDCEVKVFHDMPMHAGFEIERGAIEKNIDTILRQAENRRHTQKAIMLELLNIYQ